MRFHRIIIRLFFGLLNQTRKYACNMSRSEGFMTSTFSDYFAAFESELKRETTTCFCPGTSDADIVNIYSIATLLMSFSFTV